VARSLRSAVCLGIARQVPNNDMQLKICGVPHTVTIADSWITVDHDQNAENLRGQIHNYKHSIRIAGDAPIEQQRRVMWHEILHGIIAGMSIREFEGEDAKHLEAPISQLSLGISEALESMDNDLLNMFGLQRMTKDVEMKTSEKIIEEHSMQIRGEDLKKTIEQSLNKKRL